MSEDVVRAKRFELVNDEGTVQAALQSSGGNAASLDFYEDGEIHRAGFGVTQTGNATLTLRGHDETIYARIGIERDGRQSAFSLRDSRGNQRLQLAIEDDGTVGISVIDGEKRNRAQLALQTNGYIAFSIFDEDGNLVSEVS